MAYTSLYGYNKNKDKVDIKRASTDLCELFKHLVPALDNICTSIETIQKYYESQSIGIGTDLAVQLSKLKEELNEVNAFSSEYMREIDKW